MANPTLTLADLTLAITHSVGGTPDANLAVNDIANDALQHLANLRPWRWKERTLNLDSTNAQQFINLPADFQQLMVLKKVGDVNNLCKPVSLDQIIAMRQTGASSITDLWYAISYAPQVSQTVEPLPILEIYPTPTSTTAGAPFYLTGKYVRVIPKLTGSTSVPDIPSFMHSALRILCRAFAVSNEEQQRGADWAQFEDLIAPLEVIDGQAAGYLGRMRGGIAPPRPQSLGSQVRQIGQ